MIAIDPSISRGAYNNIVQFCERHGFTPAHTIYATSIQNLLLKVEAGLGFSVLDETASPIPIQQYFAAFYKTDSAPSRRCMEKDNLNPVIPLFTNYLLPQET